MVKLKSGRHLSAIKESRKSEKRRIENLKKKKNIQELTKKLKTAVKKKDIDSAKELLKNLYSAYDKAVKSGIMKKNKAGRKKSQVARLVSSILNQKPNP